jgi:hypothetical protein
MKGLAKRESYHKDELIDYRKVKVYIAKKILIELDKAKRKSVCQ